MRPCQGPSDRDIKKKIKQIRNSEEEYELSRFKPLLRTVIEVRMLSTYPTYSSTMILQDHIANRLDLTLFPYVKDPPNMAPVAPSLRSTPSQTTSLRSAKPSWHRAAKPGATNEIRQRIMVFVAGGVTYSEVREAYHLSNSLSKDIYIGIPFSVFIRGGFTHL